MSGGLALNAALCLTYIVLNASLNFLNRWALGVHGFAFPLTLTGAHMLFNPVLLLPVMLLKYGGPSAHFQVVQKQWKAILVVGILNGIQIALNNSSLVLMELSLNQVVRAAMPCFVALFAVVIENKTPSSGSFAALVTISLGVMLAVFNPGAGFSGDLAGSLLVLVSVAIMATQMTCSGRLGLSMDAVQMTFYTGWVSFFSIAGFIGAFEGKKFLAHASQEALSTALILGGSCLLAVVYNVVVFQTIRGLSSVGSAVLGNVKVVVILLGSAVWMGEMKEWHVRQHAGCFLTFLGAAVFSALKIQPQKKSA